jgi:hypothetical protein
MFLNIGVAEIGIVVLGDGICRYAEPDRIQQKWLGARPRPGTHNNRARYSPLLTGCLLGTAVNLVCMALVWWLLYLLGLIG